MLPSEESAELDHDYCDDNTDSDRAFMEKAVAIVTAEAPSVLTAPVLPVVRVCFACKTDIDAEEICSQCNICNVFCHLKCIGYELECSACNNAVV